MHPLTQDLTGLSMEELQNKYNDLSKKYAQAWRMGSHSILGQMQMIMDDYKQELGRRHQALLDEASSKNNNFKNLIDIKK
jgi:hypothetical protein